MSTAHRIAYDLGKLRTINDPGTGNSFDVKGRSMVRVEMVSVGASETRTLPIPSAAGLICTLIHAVDGGDIDLTVTSGFDAGGDTSMNTTTAGDFVTFISVATAATTYRWRVLAFEGFTGLTEVTAGIDLNGLADGLILDADGDTTLDSETDDLFNVKAGGTDRFRVSEGDSYNVDFNPQLRTFVRQQFNGRIFSNDVHSDWSLWKSVGSANLDWVVSGSGGFGTSANSDGGCILSHAATSSSFCFIKPSPGSPFDRQKWGTSKNPRMRVVLKTGSSIANNIITVGLYSNSTADLRLDNGGEKAIRVVTFFDQDTNASWKVDIAGTGSSSQSGDTSTSAVASTVYDIDMRVQSDRTVKVYINSALVYTSVKVLTATKNLVPMIQMGCQNNAHRGVSLYHIEMSQDIAA